MTDKEIIKALERCNRPANQTSCDDCPYQFSTKKCSSLLIKDTLDLITLQQAEIKNLKVENQSLRGAANSLKMHYEEAQAEIESLKIFREYAGKRANDYKTMRDKYLNAKSEAVKECLAKVKNYIKTHCNPYGKPDFDYDTSIKILNFIDNLVKEMVGENND